MTPAATVIAELDRYALTPAERIYAIGTVHRFCGYASAWIDVDQPDIRPLATVVAVSAACKGLEDVVRSEDPQASLRQLLVELPG